MAGLFVALEGIDGCGKSTQVAMLAAHARAHGVEPLLIREPGGTPLGERLRELLLDPATGDIAPAAEALLYAASRAELVACIVRPALRAGRLVLADRFVESSLAYQGAGRGLGIDRVLAANELALDGLWPDLTVFVQVPPAAAAARRAGDRGDDRIEAAGQRFFDRVADAYEQLAVDARGDTVIVDGAGTPEQVHAHVLAALGPRLEALLAAGASGGGRE